MSLSMHLPYKKPQDEILLPPANEVWGKVIFSQACVKNSVHRGGLLPGGCLVRVGGLLPEWVPGPGGSAPRGVPGGDPPDGYCCGRYASYWNALLFRKDLTLFQSFFETETI